MKIIKSRIYPSLIKMPPKRQRLLTQMKGLHKPKRQKSKNKKDTHPAKFFNRTKLLQTLVIVCLIIVGGGIDLLHYRLINQHKGSTATLKVIKATDTKQKPIKSYSPIVFSDTSFISMFNQVRAQNGLSALTENSELDQAAQNRAQDMVNNNYFNNSSDNPQQFITNTGYKPDLWSLQSMKDPASLTGAINSFRQDTNPSPFILNSSVTEIGVGQASGQQNNQEVEYVVVYLAKPYWCGYAGISCAQYCNMAQTSQQQSIKSEQSMLNLSLSYANSSYLTTSQRDSEIQQDYANYNAQVKADYNAYLEQVNAVPGCTVIYQPLYQNPPPN